MMYKTNTLKRISTYCLTTLQNTVQNANLRGHNSDSEPTSLRNYSLLQHVHEHDQKRTQSGTKMTLMSCFPIFLVLPESRISNVLNSEEHSKGKSLINGKFKSSNTSNE